MQPTYQQLADVLRAAQSLLTARQDQMLTSQEWERLARAVEAAEPPAPLPADATVRFAFDKRSGLTRALVARDGEVLHRQRADADAFAAIAEYAQCQRGAFFIDDVVTDLCLPDRAAAHATLEFLLESGFLERSGGIAFASATGNEFSAAAEAALHALPRRIDKGRA